MPKVYGKVNGQTVARDVAQEQLASHLRKGWLSEPPEEKKKRGRKKKSD